MAEIRWPGQRAALARDVLFPSGMKTRLAYRLDTASSAAGAPGALAESPAPAARGLLALAQAASWAVMVLGLGAASVVLVQSYLLGG